MIDWRRWMRRKAVTILPAYEDPLTTYGRMAGGKETPPPETPRTRTLWNRIFRAGHDTGFVYYDD
ncbi:MAG: hypothetical protein PHR28_02220 [candidate division Zixibacteria bacterium]|nr:hypothetical protein [candidate division Zixibacteria bacterium]